MPVGAQAKTSVFPHTRFATCISCFDLQFAFGRLKSDQNCRASDWQAMLAVRALSYERFAGTDFRLSGLW